MLTSVHEQIEMPRGRRSYRAKAEEDALAEDDQERSRNKGQVPKELQRKEGEKRTKCPTNGHSSDYAHWGVGGDMLTNWKEIRTYGIVTCQSASADGTDCGNNIPDNCIGS